MKRKSIAILALLLVLSFGLTSCKPAGSDGTDGTGNGAKKRDLI